MAGLKTNPPYMKNEDWAPAFAGVTIRSGSDRDAGSRKCAGNSTRPEK